MVLIIQKFGGSSLANTELIEKAADKVIAELNQNNQVVVVVSAIAGFTNDLVSYAKDITPEDEYHKFAADHDVIISAGEQISIGLMSIALRKKGIISQSFLGWQIPIITDKNYSQANINKVDHDNLNKALKQGITPVVAGFQGISSNGRVTTLGRGGSDLTAVAIADALKADWCDIYTDVDGVFTTDPKIVKEARLLQDITFEEMHVLASHGAKVLQQQSVESAWHRGVNLRVRSSFNNNTGTTLSRKCLNEELNSICGIATLIDRAKITLYGIKSPLRTMSFLSSLMEIAKVNIDATVQTLTENSTNEIAFIIANQDLAIALNNIKNNKEKLGYTELQHKVGKTSITLVGAVLRYTTLHKKVANLLSNSNIKFETISASGIIMSLLVDTKLAVKTINKLHQEFKLQGT